MLLQTCAGYALRSEIEYKQYRTPQHYTVSSLAGKPGPNQLSSSIHGPEQELRVSLKRPGKIFPFFPLLYPPSNQNVIDMFL
ncbi:unnamed protein product [Larinioides sclopetarius]|uniref:Uncharacterized protein n=1 Tax=Larinioides sclopetarius TaxID=280406 RepID=A0AAV2BNZ9_9ARAC